MAQQIAVTTISALSLDVSGEVIGLGPCCFDNHTVRDARRHYECRYCPIPPNTPGEEGSRF